MIVVAILINKKSVTEDFLINLDIFLGDLTMTRYYNGPNDDDPGMLYLDYDDYGLSIDGYLADCYKDDFYNLLKGFDYKDFLLKYIHPYKERRYSLNIGVIRCLFKIH